MGISVVINTYNAEQHLPACLDAVRDFDEVVVCDMESTDHTVLIAQEHGAHVVTFPKADHKSAEPARTFAIQSASNEWVLVVDADEIVTPELRHYLYHRIASTDCPAGLYIARKNKFMGHYGRDWAHDYQLRFFIREGTVWPPYVHTFPIVQGRVEKAPARYKFIHLADETMRQWVTKMNDYTDNEVKKRANKRCTVLTLLWRPRWRFFRSFILHGGFLNGKRGLVEAQLSASYQRIALAKIIQSR